MTDGSILHSKLLSESVQYLHVLFLQALDADKAEINRDLNYTLVEESTDNDLFEIDHKSGVISIIGQEYDYQDGVDINKDGDDNKATYLVKVTAANTVSPYFQDSVTVEIQVICVPKVSLIH